MADDATPATPDTPTQPPSPPPSNGAPSAPATATGAPGQAGSPPPPSQTQQQAPVPAGGASQQPKIFTQQKPHGLAGVLDEVRNWIAGTQGYGVYMDQDGNRIVQHPQLTPSQQWKKVGMEALVGGAKGFAAGQGPGGNARALAAGVQTGVGLQQQQEEKADTEAEQDYQRTRQAKIDKANDQIRQMQLAEGNFRLDRLKVQATEDEMKFWQGQDDRHTANHDTDLGTYDSDNFQEVAKRYPKIFAAHHDDNSIRTVPQFDDKGQRHGVRIWLTQPGGGNEMMPPGTSVKRYTPNPDSTKMGTWSTYVPTDPMNRAQHDSLEADAIKASNDDQSRLTGAAELAKKQFEVTHQGEEFQTKENKEKAETAAAYAKAEADRAGANAAQMGNPALTGAAYLDTIDPNYRQQVVDIASGEAAMPSASRGKEQMKLRNMVMNYDHSYMDSRYQTKMDFRTKGDATQIQNAATVLDHTEELEHASHALGFRSTGLSAAANNYDTAMKFFTQEGLKLVKNSGATQGEYEDIKTNLNSRFEWKRQGAIHMITQLMGGRTQAIKQKYETGTGEQFPVEKYFSPASQQRLQRYGMLDTPSGTGAGTYKLTATGPGGVKVGSNDGGQTWSETKTGKPWVQ